MTETPNANIQWVADELMVVEAMANELEDYIVQGDVYRTILLSTASGQRKMNMSGGDLLVRLQRLREHHATLSAEQQGRFEEVANRIQSSIYSLRTRFHDLLQRELKARRDQLNWNLEVRRDNENDQADAAEIQNREHIASIQEALKVA